MPRKAPALPRNITKPRLSLMPQDIRRLFRNDEWITIESRNTQLVFVEEFAQKDCGVTFDTTCLADVFELTRSRVRTIREKTQKEQQPPHRLLVLSNEQEFQFCEMI
jgi:hypothetical protein